jgi:transposase
LSVPAADRAGPASARGITQRIARRGIESSERLVRHRWVVERSFAWASRFRRLARDYERLQTTLAGFHYVAFALLALTIALPILAVL